MTTRFPFVVHLTAEMCTCWWGEVVSTSFTKLQISTGLGLEACTDCVWVRSNITLVFLGLAPATAEYVGNVLFEGSASPLGGFALPEGAVLAFWRPVIALFSIWKVVLMCASSVAWPGCKVLLPWD